MHSPLLSAPSQLHPIRIDNPLMASNGVKREETERVKAEEGADDAQVKVEAEENKDSVKAEADGVAPMKTEAAVEEVKVKQEENGRVKAETVENGVKIEEKIKKQELEQVQMTSAASGDVKMPVRNVKRDVKKDEETKQQEQQEDRSHIRRKAVSCESGLWDSIEWTVAAGAEVDAGQRLGTAGRLERGNQRPMQAPCKGRLYILTKEQSDELMDGKKEATGNVMRTVAFVEYCIHPVRNGRTCLMCLAVVDDEENEDMESVNVVSHGQVIRLNVEEAKKFDSDNIRRQLGAKKLSLVLDLDHTLLHAVRVDDVVGEITKSDDIYFFFIPGLAQQHVVKLRPGLTEFLTELSALYDLFIYTHGTRLYAEQIVKIIDPDETYFKNRIVARTDTPDMLHKSLKLLFPSCDDSMILVLDDRIDVWKENEGNVFLIEPYHYFKCTSEINNASGRGVAGMEDSDAESSEDRHLAQSTVVLKHVHEAFYAGHEAGMRGTTAEEQMAGNGRNVKAILSEQKRAIMHDCRIVFSGVFPIVGPQSHESHYLWRLAIDLGATPSMTLKDFPLTHLVIHPERLGTQKHVQAKKIPGVFIVTPDWILKCARSWSRVSEQDFLADEWKAKHTKKEPEMLKEEPNVSADAGAEASSGSPDRQVSTDGAAASEAKVVPGILLKREAGTAKVGKQVSFATVIDDSGKPPSEDGTTQKSKMVRRSRVIRRSSGSSRIRNIGAGAVATGVVATGGTFDFLSKIKATKREAPRASTKAKKIEESKTARFASAPKDIDDAFMRLMEAEEREHEQEEKRKQSSTDIKDQLFSRRVKKGSKRSPESNPTAAKRMRASFADEEAEEDDELDDLEADILGDL
ncbi:RNA polymerase II subunit A C-terminal domain phosphatase [Phytophthora citrophthora]|uniref:RNA polymerase II subunit A C-terminal domain phosphatase n=1 Tax=Phytophthora citrophthora TaxID=4793 RepID=A0AAD9GZK2_9STRA|nr:RNA polymerase II subunit A C-terminal domain phosphatase [Phytophthora citrophthora]